MIFRDFSWFFDLYRGGGVSEHPSRNGLERGREMAEEWPREREWKWPRRNGRERGNGKEDAQKKK